MARIEVWKLDNGRFIGSRLEQELFVRNRWIKDPISVCSVCYKIGNIGRKGYRSESGKELGFCRVFKIFWQIRSMHESAKASHQGSVTITHT